MLMDHQNKVVWLSLIEAQLLESSKLKNRYKQELSERQHARLLYVNYLIPKHEKMTEIQHFGNVAEPFTLGKIASFRP